MEQLRIELRELRNSVIILAEKHTQLETVVDRVLASRDFVRDEITRAIKPLQDAIESQAESMEAQSRNMDKLTLLAEETHRTQDALFKQRAEDEKRVADARVASLEQTSFRNVIKRAWFWILAFLAVPPIILTASEAIHKLLEFLK